MTVLILHSRRCRTCDYAFDSNLHDLVSKGATGRQAHPRLTDILSVGRFPYVYLLGHEWRWQVASRLDEKSRAARAERRTQVRRLNLTPRP